jgi:hypothetical protein
MFSRQGRNRVRIHTQASPLQALEVSRQTGSNQELGLSPYIVWWQMFLIQEASCYILPRGMFRQCQ